VNIVNPTNVPGVRPRERDSAANAMAIESPPTSATYRKLHDRVPQIIECPAPGRRSIRQRSFHGEACRLLSTYGQAPSHRYFAL
jgi:hypothetical protein